MGVPTGGLFRPRPPVGVSLRGELAEVWRGETKIGLLYQITMHGAQGDWEGDAWKYRFEEEPAGEVEVRLFLGQGTVRLEIRAMGHIAGDVVADGELHRESLRLKGTEIAVA